jgi:NAD(P) transhydrogenase
MNRSILHRAYVSSTSVLADKAASSSPKGIPYNQLVVGIPKETTPLEKRVAATPESVARLVKPGFTVQLERGAGAQSYFSDQAYEQAGAKIVDNVWKDSDIVLKVSFNNCKVIVYE